MRTLDYYDRLIIHYLGNAGQRNMNEIAEELGISWATVHKHVLRLEKLKFLSRKKRNGKTVWAVNLDE